MKNKNTSHGLFFFGAMALLTFFSKGISYKGQNLLQSNDDTQHHVQHDIQHDMGHPQQNQNIQAPENPRNILADNDFMANIGMLIEAIQTSEEGREILADMDINIEENITIEDFTFNPESIRNAFHENERDQGRFYKEHHGKEFFNFNELLKNSTSESVMFDHLKKEFHVNALNIESFLTDENFFLYESKKEIIDIFSKDIKDISKGEKNKIVAILKKFYEKNFPSIFRSSLKKLGYHRNTAFVNIIPFVPHGAEKKTKKYKK